ncbi:MAG: DNA mismatch endonuclease Vsr [Solirubrobacterales bacterium]|nr:DNA mismatch endonuclease Vsr [Solirubrobacterales bacterium]
MADVVSSEKRSEMMAGIRGKDTGIEIQMRRALHARGFRYRLHAKDLPGKPDIVLPKYNAVVMVNGCFWHGHDCNLFRLPATNREKWRRKLDRNRQRDSENLVRLNEAGWRVIEVWECAVRGVADVEWNDVAEAVDEWIHSDSGNATVRGT